jgi:hypothetical protein
MLGESFSTGRDLHKSGNLPSGCEMDVHGSGITLSFFKKEAQMPKSISFVVAAAGLLALSQATKAQVTGNNSDRMVISGPPGVGVIFDQSIPEIVPEPTLGFGGTPNPVVIPAGLPGLAVTQPGVSVVLFLEATPEPGEAPPIYTDPRTSVQYPLSDAIIDTVGNNGVTVPPLIMLVSDGGSDLQAVATDLANATQPPVIMAETGDLQDLTPFLGSTFPGISFPIDIQVQSDVAEPVSLSMLGLGACGLLRRRRR